ncbi:MAG TPA: hypothetical protein VII73_08265 [Caulobacteraceae bacterium]
MPRLSPSLALIAIAVSPMGVHAETAAPSAVVGRLAISLTDVQAAIDRPYAPLSMPARGDFSKTVVDYGFAPKGLVASVGYVCVPDGHPLDSPGADSDGSSRFGRQDELVGAALNYAFK